MSIKTQKLNWISPLNLAKKISDNYKDESWIFLYSGLSDEVKNSRSFIALFPQKELLLNNLDELKKQDGSWFGYVSYEYGQNLEKLPQTKKSFINLPKICLINFSLIFEFDHDKKSLNAYFSKQEQLDEILNYQEKITQEKTVKVKNFSSNFSDEEYLKTVDEIREMIACGDFYQVNLTRKFFGNFNLENQNDFFQLFTKLSTTSPANYSNFLKIHDNFIISSSPELFIKIKNDEVISCPIKGTAPRGASLKQDKENKKNLQNSDKEKAENLMIVDLVRNDLSRVCKAKSVKVKNLFKINSYKTLHHMSSEIHGKIADNFDIIDTFKTCFPPGSMTGAPKIKAMEIIAQKEKLNRGIYSGAIGYFANNEANFSVVIRTLICQKNKFEFQVGGAITFDSKAQSELQETFDKAKAISKILNLS